MNVALWPLTWYLRIAKLELMGMWQSAATVKMNISSTIYTFAPGAEWNTAMSALMIEGNAHCAKKGTPKEPIRILQTFKIMLTATVNYWLLIHIDCNKNHDGTINFYPDCAHCLLSSITEDSAVVGTCLACKNGFMHSGECVNTCPRGYYGSKVFNRRGYLTSSECVCKSNIK